MIWQGWVFVIVVYVEFATAMWLYDWWWETTHGRRPWWIL